MLAPPDLTTAGACRLLNAAIVGNHGQPARVAIVGDQVLDDIVGTAVQSVTDEYALVAIFPWEPGGGPARHQRQR